MYRDRVRITVVGGRGGDGCVSFRREKYVPKGGPDGGDGGRGGDVIVTVDTSSDDLSHIRSGSTGRAENGKPGGAGNKHGRYGEPLKLAVPEGTHVYNDERDKLIAQMGEQEKEVLVARGGRGGRGNLYFATSTDRTPRKREKGTQGRRVRLRLEYLPAVDVCIIGLPNAGKSTLLSRLSSARPKIAEYPFTTRLPALGTFIDEESRKVTVMELPAIVEDSHGGKGFGERWMGHMRRARLLLFLIDISSKKYRDAYDLLIGEVSSFDQVLLNKLQVLVLNKTDLLKEEPQLPEIQNKKVAAVQTVSLKTGEGVSDLKTTITRLLAKNVQSTEDEVQSTPCHCEEPEGDEAI